MRWRLIAYEIGPRCDCSYFQVALQDHILEGGLPCRGTGISPADERNLVICEGLH
jgi:hypothetical protein